jgi:hypothetical protein
VVTNHASVTCDYTFVVWKVDPNHSDFEFQINQAQYGVTIPSGEQRDITVGFSEQCGAMYQRDVLIGIKGKDGERFTPSDLGNYPLLAPGAYWNEPKCGDPAVIPASGSPAPPITPPTTPATPVTPVTPSDPPPVTPVVDKCSGPFINSGPERFDLSPSADAVELAYVQQNVSTSLVGPSKLDQSADHWVATGDYPVVLVKGAQASYSLYTNVRAGDTLLSPSSNQNGQLQNISHVSLFRCEGNAIRNARFPR